MQPATGRFAGTTALLTIAPLAIGVLGYAFTCMPIEAQYGLTVWVLGSIPIGIAVGNLILDRE